MNLNSQMMHHMFPSVHPCHYPALRHILIPVAKKHGLDYEGRSSNNFYQAVAQYLQWLNELNETPEFADKLLSPPTQMLASIWFVATGSTCVLLTHFFL